MPAPIVSALGYFLAPRVAGDAANQAMASRVDTLRSQGQSDEQISADTYLNLLGLVPRRSTAESAYDALRNLLGYRTEGMPQVPPDQDGRTIEDIVSGRGLSDPSVQTQYYMPENSRGQPEFITPMDDFLKYGGRDADNGMANGGLAALLRGMYAQR